MKPLPIPATPTLPDAPSNPVQDLRALVAKRIAELKASQADGGFVDTAELVRLAGALKGIDSAEPAVATNEHDEIDVSGMSDAALEELVEAGRRGAETRGWSPERKAAHLAQRAEEQRQAETRRLEARRKEQELMERGRRCTCFAQRCT